MIKQINPKETTVINFLLIRRVRTKSFRIIRVIVGAKKKTTAKLISTSHPQCIGVNWPQASIGRIRPQSHSRSINTGLRV